MAILKGTYGATDEGEALDEGFVRQARIDRDQLRSKGILGVQRSKGSCRMEIHVTDKLVSEARAYLAELGIKID